MTQKQRDEFIEELKSKGYSPWMNSFRHNYYDYYRIFNKDKVNQYTIAFREWDLKEFIDRNESIRESPYSFDVTIRFSHRVCELQMSYPDVCKSIEEAEEGAKELSEVILKKFHLYETETICEE